LLAAISNDHMRHGSVVALTPQKHGEGLVPLSVGIPAKFIIRRSAPRVELVSVYELLRRGVIHEARRTNFTVALRHVGCSAINAHCCHGRVDRVPAIGFDASLVIRS